MTQQQQLQMPDQMMAMQFAQIVNELTNAPQPMKAIYCVELNVESAQMNGKINQQGIEYYNLRWDGEFE